VKTLILVTGQHRSGTSATAGCLERLGVELGTRLMPANNSNPRGYFEDVRVVNVHDRLLGELGARWDRPEDIPTAWLAQPATHQAMARLGPVLRSFSADTFAIKDPRAALFMPMWELLCAAEDVRLTVLQPLRKPEAVVNSLVTREGWMPDRAQKVWRGYQRAITEWEGMPGAAIDFPHELWQASAWERVANCLDVELDITRIGRVHGFLDGGLVHHG